MERSYILLIIASSLVLIAIGLVVFSSSNIQSSPDSECSILKYSSEGAINLLFISDQSTAEKYSSYLLSKSPFNQYPDSFNVYYLSGYAPNCELYKGIALFCYSKEIIKSSSSCPHDYIFVAESQPSNIRSSSYRNVVSINTLHQQSVILHEFGHAFANLAEEYIIPGSPARGSNNCVQSCDYFGDLLNECKSGCSDSLHLRSIDNGVMRTLDSEEYGIFNEKTLSKKLESDSGITGNVISDQINCDSQRYYLIDGSYFEGELKINSVSLENGCSSISEEQGDLSYRIISSGEEIKEGNLNLNIFTDVQSEETLSGETYEGSQFFVTVPQSLNPSEIQLYDNDQTVTQSLAEVGYRPCRV